MDAHTANVNEPQMHKKELQNITLCRTDKWATFDDTSKPKNTPAKTSVLRAPLALRRPALF